MAEIVHALGNEDHVGPLVTVRHGATGGLVTTGRLVGQIDGGVALRVRNRDVTVVAPRSVTHHGEARRG